MSRSNKEKGKKGEELAKRFLEKKGLKIAHRNWSCGFGEIDIVAYDGNTLVFIEVKSSAGSTFGKPVEWVNVRKRKHIVKSAKQYLFDNSIEDINIRFDVVAIDLLTNKIQHIPDAFICEEES